MKISLLLLSLFLGDVFLAQEYFQQEVNYTISVKLNDKKHELIGYEEFEYHNNSDSVLSFIYIHLWPNAYKNNKTTLAKALNGSLEARDKEDYGYIDSLDFKINGVKAVWSIEEKHIDIAKIILNNPLKKGESIKISTPFKVKIPSGDISRLGHIGESYQVTQWYPKPAVFDNEAIDHDVPFRSLVLVLPLRNSICGVSPILPLAY